MSGIVYSIKDSRYNRSSYKGMTHVPGARMSFVAEEPEKSIVLEPVDGADPDGQWGRLKFNIEIEESMAYYVYAFASDFKEGVLPDLKAIKRNALVREIGKSDILLYSLSGRYLYIAIEIVGIGAGYISDMMIDKHGDDFMEAFPEIYKERDSFFHRYMSVFSSMFGDFQNNISKLPEILDLDKCPAELLSVYGHWLGIDIDCDFKSETIQRDLVREAYNLNRMKGTKAVIVKLGEIIFGQPVIVLEKNIMEQYQEEQYMEQFIHLFGSNVYNVCILIQKKISEVQKSQFMYMVKQFVPIRAKIQIVNLDKDGELDFHSYLDVNAKLFDTNEGKLDDSMRLDYAVTLV